jgi:hypothetical protein
VRAGTGRIIDSQDEVGGYPDHEPAYRELDIPETDLKSWLASFEHRPSD